MELASSLPALVPADFEASRRSMLEGELARIEELLELEPDCKWALLARGRLATACAAAQPSRLQEVERSLVDGYAQIAAIDPLRRGFYAEASATSSVRLRLLSWLSGATTMCDLSGLSWRLPAPSMLTAAFGVKVLNIEGNELRELTPFLILHTLEELRASRNNLKSDVCEAFFLPRLRILDVSANDMVLGTPKRAPPVKLEHLDLSRNPQILDLASGGSSGVLSCLSIDDGEVSKWNLEADGEVCKCWRKAEEA